MGAAFSAVTAVERVAPGRFVAAVDAAWTIAGKPNGGYLLAILARAATRHDHDATADGPAADRDEHPHVVAASAHYLRAAQPGPVDVWVETLRAGRSASQLRVRMSQDDHACVEALFTVSRLDADAEPYWSHAVPQRGGSADREGIRLRGVSPAGFAVPIMDEVELRIDPPTAGFLRGEPSGRGELRGWLALPDDEPFDPTSLLFALDAFPPATFDIELTGWVPTLELTAYVRALPAPGPVQVLQRARLVDGRRVDEECWVWDSTGRVVAQATQLAAIRLG